MSQPIRTLGAAALGAPHRGDRRPVRPARPGRRGADDRAPATHDHGLGHAARSPSSPTSRGSTSASRSTKPTVKAARKAGAQAMTDIIAAVKALGDRRGRHPDDEPQPAAVRQRIRPEGRRLPDQRADRGHRPRPRQGRRRGRRGDGAAGATDVNGISFELADPVKARTTPAPPPSTPPGRAPRRWRAPATSRSGPSSRSPTGRPSPADLWLRRPGSRREPDVGHAVQPGTQDLSATVTVVFEIS